MTRATLTAPVDTCWQHVVPFAENLGLMDSGRRKHGLTCWQHVATSWALGKLFRERCQQIGCG